MNYSKMSGYEINSRLHNAIACGSKYDLKVEGYKVVWTEKETGRVIETLRKQYDKQFKDYLSSWADAGQIILENRISIVAQAEDWCAEGRGVYPVPNINPLRAAMIVFLMMQEAK